MFGLGLEFTFGLDVRLGVVFDPRGTVRVSVTS